MPNTPHITIVKVIPKFLPSSLFFLFHPLRKIIFSSKHRSVRIFTFSESQIFAFDKFFFGLFGIDLEHNPPKLGKPDYEILMDDKYFYDLLIPGGGILPKEIIERCKTGAMLFHFGELPYYRGMDTIEWSILFGRQVKTTCFFYADKIDAGDIVCCDQVPIANTGNLNKLIKKTHSKSWELLTSAAKEHMAGREIARSSQENASYNMYYGVNPRLRKMIDNKLRGVSNHNNYFEIEQIVKTYKYVMSTANTKAIDINTKQTGITKLHRIRKQDYVDSEQARDIIESLLNKAGDDNSEHSILLFNELLFFYNDTSNYLPKNTEKFSLNALSNLRKLLEVR